MKCALGFLVKRLDIQEDWELQMESALHNNVFVLPVGEDRLWLRYHHLFQDFLQERIRREKPVEAEKIQLELANYYADQQDWDRVFQYLPTSWEKYANCQNYWRRLGQILLPRVG